MFDMSGLWFVFVMAIIGVIVSVLFVIGLIVATVAYFLGYWSFGVTI